MAVTARGALTESSFTSAALPDVPCLSAGKAFHVPPADGRRSFAARAASWGGVWLPPAWVSLVPFSAQRFLPFQTVSLLPRPSLPGESLSDSGAGAEFLDGSGCGSPQDSQASVAVQKQLLTQQSEQSVTPNVSGLFSTYFQVFLPPLCSDFFVSAEKANTLWCRENCRENSSEALCSPRTRLRGPTACKRVRAQPAVCSGTWSWFQWAAESDLPGFHVWNPGDLVTRADLFEVHCILQGQLSVTLFAQSL